MREHRFSIIFFGPPRAVLLLVPSTVARNDVTTIARVGVAVIRFSGAPDNANVYSDFLRKTESIVRRKYIYDVVCSVWKVVPRNRVSTKFGFRSPGMVGYRCNWSVFTGHVGNVEKPIVSSARTVNSFTGND